MPFQLVFGRLVGFYEPKLFYTVFVLGFEVGSILCATSPNSAIFILGRAVAGFGAAGMTAGGFAIIGHTPMRERPRLMAFFTALQAVAYTSGPTMSGALTDSYLTVSRPLAPKLRPRIPHVPAMPRPLTTYPISNLECSGASTSGSTCVSICLCYYYCSFLISLAFKCSARLCGSRHGVLCGQTSTKLEATSPPVSQVEAMRPRRHGSLDFLSSIVIRSPGVGWKHPPILITPSLGVFSRLWRSGCRLFHFPNDEEGQVSHLRLGLVR